MNPNGLPGEGDSVPKPVEGLPFGISASDDHRCATLRCGALPIHPRCEAGRSNC